MGSRKAMGVGAGLAAAVLAAPVALADTCCANVAIPLEPETARPGDTIRLEGIRCLASDNSGPLELVLKGFWLSTDDIPADPSPGDAPGSGLVHLAEDLPPVEAWHPFADITGAGQATAGSATIVVPALAPGSYQLWWWCDNGGGPGSGIHYSGGPRLVIGSAAPDTAMIEPVSGFEPTVPLLPLSLAAIAAGLATLRRVHVVAREPRRPG